MSETELRRRNIYKMKSWTAVTPVTFSSYRQEEKCNHYISLSFDYLCNLWYILKALGVFIGRPPELYKCISVHRV